MNFFFEGSNGLPSSASSLDVPDGHAYDDSSYKSILHIKTQQLTRSARVVFRKQTYHFQEEFEEERGNMGASQSIDSTDQFTTSLAALKVSLKQASNAAWALFHGTSCPQRIKHDTSGTTPIDQPMNRVQDDVDLGVKSAKHSAAAPLIRRTSSLAAFQRTSSLDSGSAVKAGDDSFASPIVRPSSDSSLCLHISSSRVLPCICTTTHQASHFRLHAD